MSTFGSSERKRFRRGFRRGTSCSRIGRPGDQRMVSVATARWRPRVLWGVRSCCRGVEGTDWHRLSAATEKSSPPSRPNASAARHVQSFFPSRSFVRFTPTTTRESFVGVNSESSAQCRARSVSGRSEPGVGRPPPLPRHHHNMRN